MWVRKLIQTRYMVCKNVHTEWNESVDCIQIAFMNQKLVWNCLQMLPLDLLTLQEWLLTKTGLNS